MRHECRGYAAQSYGVYQSWMSVVQGKPIPAYADEWTTDMRRQGIDVLKALKQKEEEALALLQELV